MVKADIKAGESIEVLMKSFKFERVAVLLAVLIPIVTLPMWVFSVFPQQKDWCMRAYPNGQTEVLHGTNCWRHE